MSHLRLGSLAASLLALILLATFTFADEWNDSFDPPRSYVVLRDIIIRSARSNASSALGTVSKGTKVQVTSIKNGWLGFKLESGVKGYIFKRYLKPVDAGQQKSTSPAPKSEPGQNKKDKKKTDSSESIKTSEPLPAEQKTSTDLNALEKKILNKKTPSAEQTPKTKPKKKPESKQKTSKKPKKSPEQKVVKNSELKKEAGSEQKKQPAGITPENMVTQSVAEPDEVQAQNNNAQSTKTDTQAQKQSEEQHQALMRQIREQDANADYMTLAKAKCKKYLTFSFLASEPDEKTSESGKPAPKNAKTTHTLSSGGQACYRTLVLKGKELYISLATTNGTAQFDVYTPTSGRIAHGQTQWTTTTRSSGDKVIVVTAPKGEAAYELNVRIR